jgi:PadR family transcriptional regulator, regulatory protein PadR
LRPAPGQGTLYPLLQRLEQEGLLAGRWEARQGGPERRVYRLTPDGAAALAGWRAEWATFTRVIGRFLAPAGAGAPA